MTMTKSRQHGPCQKFAVVSGAGANTNIAVSGITTEDELVFVLELSQTDNNPTDRTSTTSITSDGYVQCTTATDNDKLLILWNDLSA